MIAGIGTDMIEIERIRKACEKEAFLVRCFRLEEREFFRDNYVKAAGNFAVKEAVAKALGTGFRTFLPSDMAVLREASGRPYVLLYGGAKEVSERLRIRQIHVSITNTERYAQAFVVAEAEEDEQAV